MNASTPARVSGNTAYSKTDNISRPPDSPFPNIIYQKDPQAAPAVTSRTQKGTPNNDG
ncbi:MAG: hypothetical protein JWQ23_1753 [Herminiimonas sp.]|nr:hypothetical protein [Herminiimonas sp.]